MITIPIWNPSIQRYTWIMRVEWHASNLISPLFQDFIVPLSYTALQAENAAREALPLVKTVDSICKRWECSTLCIVHCAFLHLVHCQRALCSFYVVYRNKLPRSTEYHNPTAIHDSWILGSYKPLFIWILPSLPILSVQTTSNMIEQYPTSSRSLSQSSCTTKKPSSICFWS